MNKPSISIWLAIVLLLILPPAAGKFILNIAGGLMILFLIIPLVLISLGWIGWKILQSKLTKCDVCEANYINTNSICPVCGNISKNENDSDSLNSQNNSIPASKVTIDITPKKLK
tara:strand:+ start:393 stop:737 length:345 start_codon:yes stop_codon:yes gene_type:complete